MKKQLLLLFTVFLCSSAFAQMDTIYTAGKKIACSVKEISENTVRFTYPNEDLMNSLNYNIIEKIVFKSGRVQTFANAMAYRNLTSPEDYEKITMAQLESEIKGLYKLGETNAKAKGTTEFSSQERVKQRAMKKLKQKAAMMGGNVIYMLNMRQAGNTSSWSVLFGTSTSAETSLTGIVYTNALPSVEKFKSKFANESNYRATTYYKLGNSDADYTVSNTDKDLHISNINYENGYVNISGRLDGKELEFKVSYVNDNDFHIYYFTKNAIIAYRIEK